MLGTPILFQGLLDKINGNNFIRLRGAGSLGAI